MFQDSERVSNMASGFILRCQDILFYLIFFGRCLYTLPPVCTMARLRGQTDLCARESGVRHPCEGSENSADVTAVKTARRDQGRLHHLRSPGYFGNAVVSFRLPSVALRLRAMQTSHYRTPAPSTISSQTLPLNKSCRR